MKNQIILIGNAGNDPEVKVFDSGAKVAKFSLATTEHFKNAAGEKQEKTQWHTVIFYNKLADTVEQYVKKGSRYFIEGKVEYRQYEVEGQTRYITEVIAKEIKFL